MDLTMSERKSVSRIYAKRYKKSGRRGRIEILTEFTQLTGYRRDYASFLLRNWGKKVYLNKGKAIMVGEFMERRKGSGRKREYGVEVLNILLKFWELLNYPCGKRLKSELEELLKKSMKFKELKIPFEIWDKLLKISPASIDRILKPVRKSMELKPRAKTKPGSLLKKDIQIRTGTEWDEDEVGFLEIDLVSHDGGNSRGDFCQTLNCVDIKSFWVDFAAVKNKAQIWVFEALKDVRNRLPFSLKGIDSDNGSEFINNHLFNYCNENEIKFTRSRPYRKNDNCFVEEKNYTVVRSYVGYYRYDTDDQINVLNELYSFLRLYVNYFQPSMKLIYKSRMGAKVIKKYDKPKTPFKRILEDDVVSDKIKDSLKDIYQRLNPFELKRNINKLQDKLFRMSYLRKRGGEFYDKKIS